MRSVIGKHVSLVFLIPALLLTNAFITIPAELEWDILLFLCIMVVFDQVNLKVFSGFGYSFFNVILSLIVFDRFSIVYGFIYLLVDSIMSILLKKRGRLQSILSLLSIYTIIIIVCNELYNGYSDMDYQARYLTSLFMLFLSVLLKYVYVYLETGAATTKLFLDRFGPMLFEVGIVFPILAFYDHLEINLVLILFLSYYTFIGFLHKKFIGINQAHIDIITEKFSKKYKVEFYFMDLGEIKGICYFEKKMIAIDEKLDYPEQLQTIIHELLHFHMRRFNFPIKTEEMIITFFEATISWYCIVTLKHRIEIE
ncbi:ImmA/IrrE family metallo-endopeptidase [Neobacillus sp. YIM B06451]|uniref:ImmA/IrrE family metallo-endopeptidase n=1 Tax=Neobacillus sp. YIM B06451 TaxID=3070994 RepID=UPI00292ED693|nr:ImmA/IrrE family metallo-endopeptidase [Neobacillus sp. YIM B06451]